MKVGGVVNGSTVANYKHVHNKGQVIKVDFRPDGMGPVNRTVGCLLIHEIGSAVRDKVPMMPASFKKLGEEDRRIVYDHLSLNFLITAKDDQLWNHIFKNATERNKCKTKFGSFWKIRMGDEIDEPSVLDEQGPIPLATELDIKTQVIGQKHGTYISGTGKSFKRPPLPRGGARNSKLKDQLQKQREDFLEMKAALEDRIRVLEDLVVRGGSANINGNNVSEGATSYGPAN